MGTNHSRNKNPKPHLKGPRCLTTPFSHTGSLLELREDPESCLSSPSHPTSCPFKGKSPPLIGMAFKTFQVIWVEQLGAGRAKPPEDSWLPRVRRDRSDAASPLHGSSGPTKTTGRRAGLRGVRTGPRRARPTLILGSKADFSLLMARHQPTH